MRLSGRNAAVFAATCGIALAVAACDLGGDSAGWVRYGAEDQSVTVFVGPDADALPVSLELLSTTETVVVGTATVTPGGGPVGTQHDVVIELADEYEGDVARVTLTTSGDRGSQKHVLVQDSADVGLWKLPITSLGAPDEVREDNFTVDLWRSANDGEEADPNAEVEDT